MSDSAITGNKLGTDLCSAMGISASGVRSITIKMLPFQAVVIEIERHMSETESGKLVSLLQAYQLTEKARGA